MHRMIVAMFCFGMAPVALAQKHAGTGAAASGAEAFWVGPAVSGTWSDPARSGEGVVLQMLPDGQVAAVWFTYPAVGEPGEQAWLLGVSDRADGERLSMETVVQPQGARFGAAFDPTEVVQVPWGRFEFEFRDCNQLVLRYEGPVAYGRGERQLQRLTELDEVQCSGVRDLLPNGARSATGLRSRSGTWYVPERNGEGWLVEEFPDGRSGVYWFTFDESGQQRWIAGVGVREGEQLRLEQPFSTHGARFGEAFRPDAVRFRSFGTIALESSGCNSLRLDYQALRPEQGSARREAVRLTRVAGAPCLDALPPPADGARWRQAGTMAGGGEAEFAAIAAGAHIYTLGGFAAPRAFRRFTPATGRWLDLPGLPEGRNHLAGFFLGDAVYAIGGYRDQVSQPYAGAYRFDLSRQAWTAVPGVLPSSASNTALLFGRAFIGSDDGSLQEFVPATGRARSLGLSEAPVGRDHAQVVAFLDEVWMLGGRAPETSLVSIYDPVARRWRRGPAMIAQRSGFAAAVADDRIIATGGELLSTTPPRVIDSTEIYAAGSAGWAPGPALPQALHGLPGVGLEGKVFVLGGAPRAGGAGGTDKIYVLEIP